MYANGYVIRTIQFLIVVVVVLQASGYCSWGVNPSVCQSISVYLFSSCCMFNICTLFARCTCSVDLSTTKTFLTPKSTKLHAISDRSLCSGKFFCSGGFVTRQNADSIFVNYWAINWVVPINYCNQLITEILVFLI